MGGDGSSERPDEPHGRGAADVSSSGRIRVAWRTWLAALATDAEAVLAAAMTYDSMPPEARDAWLDALEGDVSAVGVPAVALYAPLLAAEADPARRSRIEAAMGADPACSPSAVAPASAVRGVAGDGTHACAIVASLYLDFVQVLWCRYTPAGGFISVRHDPLRHAGDMTPVAEVDGVAVEPTPLRVVVEELAHAILADRRGHRETPAALASFAHLFGPELDDAEGADPPDA